VKLLENDLQRNLREVDEDGSGLIGFEEFLRFLKLRVIESVRDASFVDTKLTVATLLVGKGSQIEAWIFRTVVRHSGFVGKLLWVCWYSGLVLGLASQQTFVLNSETFRVFSNASSLLMLPLPCFAFMVLSVDLIKELLYHGEMWALLFLECSWTFTAIRLLRDIRCVFWICLMPSVVVAAISDAYPAKFRSDFQIRFMTGLVLAMVWWSVIVSFGWNDPMTDIVWEFKKLKASAATASVTNVGTALLFACRNLWCAFRSPDTFVIIVSATRTTQVQVRDALAPGTASLCLNSLSMRPSEIWLKDQQHEETRELQEENANLTEQIVELQACIEDLHWMSPKEILCEPPASILESTGGNALEASKGRTPLKGSKGRQYVVSL
jgi:hypothetical protein